MEHLPKAIYTSLSTNAFPKSQVTHGIASSDWLALRRQLDARSRARNLLEELIADPPQGPCLDLGGGFGAHLEYLAAHFSGVQTWKLVERDVKLLGAMPTFFSKQGWQVTQLDENIWHVVKDNTTLSIELACCDFLQDGPLWQTSPFALVTANAVFDMLSEEETKRLCRRLAAMTSRVYFTIHINSICEFYPETSLDRSFIEGFQGHMQRNQAGRYALGCHSVDCLTTSLEESGFCVRRAKSDWVLRSYEKACLEAKVAFIAQACLDVPGFADQQVVETWWKEKLDAIASQEVEIRVGHEDILGVKRS